MSINGKTLISAVMPTRNRPELVRHSIEIFLDQTWKVKELLIIDDSDRPAPPPEDPRVKYIHLEAPMTVGEKHNLGVRLAQGQIIAHWDDDDWFSPRRLMVQMEPIALGDAQVTGIPVGFVLHGPSGRWFRFTDKSVTLMQRRKKPDQMNRLPFHDGTAIFDRDVMARGIIYPDVTVGQKLFFLNDLVDAGVKVKPVENRNHFVYLRHDRNTWKFSEGRMLEEVSGPRWFPMSEISFFKGAA